jgi:hypothetical protein
MLAASFAVLLGVVGIGIDVGRLYFARTDVQRIADSAALAGGQELPSAIAAASTIDSFVATNSDGDTAVMTFGTTYTTGDTVNVTVQRTVSFWFLKYLGVGSSEVARSATVRTGTYLGGTGVLPIAITTDGSDHNEIDQNACYLGQAGGIPTMKANTVCTLVYGRGFSGYDGAGEDGDFGALQVDGNDTLAFEDSLADGSTASVLKNARFDALISDVADETDTAISERLAEGAPGGCGGHAKTDVLRSNADGTYSVKPECESSPRIAVIPVVNDIDTSGVHRSRVIGFLTVFIHGSTTLASGHTGLSVEFVKYVTPLHGGNYGAGNGSTATELVD